MYELVIKGFKNKDEAETFLSWYSGQGEQDAAYWYEEVARTKDVRDWIGCDDGHPDNNKWTGDQLTMVVK